MRGQGLRAARLRSPPGSAPLDSFAKIIEMYFNRIYYDILLLLHVVVSDGGLSAEADEVAEGEAALGGS